MPDSRYLIFAHAHTAHAPQLSQYAIVYADGHAEVCMRCLHCDAAVSIPLGAGDMVVVSVVRGKFQLIQFDPPVDPKATRH
jgi:hypothetical protein